MKRYRETPVPGMLRFIGGAELAFSIIVALWFLSNNAGLIIAGVIVSAGIMAWLSFYFLAELILQMQDISQKIAVISNKIDEVAFGRSSAEKTSEPLPKI